MDFVVEPQRRTPVSADVDVLVAGGGPAGIAAAVAAAREGAQTLLVERFGYLGGMITGARVIWVLGVGDGMLPKATGITLDVRRRLASVGGVTPLRAFADSGDYAVDAEMFKWQAAEMLHEAGAEVLLHTMVCDPMVIDGCVQAYKVSSPRARAGGGPFELAWWSTVPPMPTSPSGRAANATTTPMT
jgi:flavin-dependent dehydrogenase